MRIYYDTEFTNLDGINDWDLISAGFITEHGHEWYVEITDFNEETCSDFVRETVLPLLKKGNKLPERMLSTHIAWRLCQWLEAFNEPLIELVSDAACDWSIVNAYCYTEFSSLPVKVRGQLWRGHPSKEIREALVHAESEFWQANPGMQHHALYDARRLKLIADRQREMLAAGDY